MSFIPYNNTGPHSPHRRDHLTPSFGTFVDEHEEEGYEDARELVAVMAMVAVRASRNEVSPERC